ncbi:MAG: hypothetical protein JXR49_04785, partial [Acidobacteria bacterium]|nr:hypothetical protein [Acidobacteriota bacterium]
ASDFPIMDINPSRKILLSCCLINLDGACVYYMQMELMKKGEKMILTKGSLALYPIGLRWKIAKYVIFA